MRATNTSPSPSPEQDLEQLQGDLQESAVQVDSAGVGRVYRGRSVSELIPKIQADLGSEAVVTGRRSGLEGGIAGFFQRPFVEIEAQPGGPRVDLRDGEEALPPLTLEESRFADELVGDPRLASPLERFAGEGLTGESGFANALAAAAGEGSFAAQTEGPLPGSSPAAAGAASYAPAAVNGHGLNGNGVAQANGDGLVHENGDGLVHANGNGLVHANGNGLVHANGNGAAHHAAASPAAAPSRTEAALAAELTGAGFDEAFVAQIIESAAGHVLPFAPRLGLRRAARVALERHLPHTAPLPHSGGVVVLVGPGGAGKTKCIAAISDRYGRSDTLPIARGEIRGEGDGTLELMLTPQIAAPVAIASKQAQSALTVARVQGLALLDTPALSPADAPAIRGLARILAELAAERVIVTLPATLSASAATRLLEALRPLKANALAITHADESDQLGVAVQAACAFGLAPEYLLTGIRGDRALARLEPSTLVERLLP